jgi:tetratricopeptide (TPR) repeat protein
MHQRAGSESGQADTLNALGDALLAEGQASEAQRQYVTALRLASKIGLKHDRARAYRGLGRVHQRTGSPDEAREHLRRALALYIELGVPEAEEVRALLAEAEQAAPAAPSAPVPQAHEPGDS